MEVLYHPFFTTWFTELVDLDVEIAGEVQALIDALGVHGRALGDPESHALLSSRMGLRSLRRTPATSVTPYAVDPPVLRILYGFMDRGRGGVAAVLLLGGDKTELGNAWYPRCIGEAERRLTLWVQREGWSVVR